MKVTIIGVGAIGGFIAAKLLKAGHDVQLLVREKSLLRKTRQLIVIGHQDFCVPYKNIITHAQDISGDIIILTTKTVQNPQLFPQLSHLKNKKIVLLQNGIQEEDHLFQWVGPSNTIIGAVSHIKVTMHADKRIELQNDALNFIYARLDKAREDNDLHHLMMNVFDSVECKPNILQTRFPKLMINAACNGISVLHNQSMYGLSQDADSRQLIRQIANEVIRVARAYSVTLEHDSIENLLDRLSAEQYRDAFFSMKIDYDNNQPLEIESIYANLINMATQKAVLVPTIERVHRELNKLVAA